MSELWFQCLSPRPAARLRLIAFPYAGGGASIFRGWDDTLPWDLELCAVRLPGREARISEAPIDRMERLLPALAGAVRQKMDRPVAFFGHSLGALVAYELARELARTGGPMPTRLLLSARVPPQLATIDRPIHALPRDELVAALERFQAIPRAVLADRELLDLVLPTLRADIALVERHVFVEAPVLELPFTIFGATLDAYVSPGELEGWRPLTRGPTTVELFEGDHFYLNDPRHRPGLIRAIGRALAP